MTRYWRAGDIEPVEVTVLRTWDGRGRTVLTADLSTIPIAKPIALVPLYEPPEHRVDEDGVTPLRPRMVLTR